MHKKIWGFYKEKNIYIFNLNRQIVFFPFFVEESKSINMNFLLPTLHDSFDLKQ